ncbi:hypothetical protein Bpfe_012318 [Biomphalaria pfeifferi]|uniref:Uncharacterized protein n=1 Tax=Biomphalaria pfeifferi TaxID=112525 RepID=A0AAD8BP75_BIOPF|nr:hypothetical protein Bpfe_012318 [Biomphalaria pfeifferi]
MSAFAASYIAANDHDDDRHQHHHQVLDEGKMTWWQKLQYRYNCCLIDWLVLCFCKQGKSCVCVCFRNVECMKHGRLSCKK